ncbi:MAG: ABC transporter permease [Bacteroidales bacterium]|jgi:putative ABC transport system permease protein|nr:ABC transporter permease [Bacteroidales bacterium]
MNIFYQKKRNKLFKIFSLAVGLSMGLVLLSKVYFDLSYDAFFPDSERIYQIQSNIRWNENDREDQTFGQVSGGVAPGMLAEIPEVETATRFTFIATDDIFVTADKRKFVGTFLLGDTCLFDMFPLPLLAGNAKEILSQPMYALVSSAIAEKMGGTNRAVGQVIQLESAPGRMITIGGVFRALPKNSHLNKFFDVIVSMPSIARFMWDGSMNWIGNDRYLGYVKLVRGVRPEQLDIAVAAMCTRHQPAELMQKAGISLGYGLKPLSEVHGGDSDVRRMMLILSILAFLLLFTAVMNYLLAVVSSLVTRAKEIAVRKCYGASGASIYRKALSGALTDLLLSLALSAALVFSFRDLILSLLKTHISDLFTLRSGLLLLGVCTAIFLIAGFVSGRLYASIPVAAAFRRIGENKRRWKLGSLLLQFTVAGFFVCLMTVIHRQYRHMVDYYPGYSYENLAYCNLSGVDGNLRQKALDEVSRLPEVAAATTSDNLLFDRASGNNIMLPDDDKELFNVADLYQVGNGYLNLMEIPVTDGRAFAEDAAGLHEVMVSRSFAEKIEDFTDWDDGVVGKVIQITEHQGLFTVCGVYENVLLGVIGSNEDRPSVMFHTDRATHNLLIKFHHQTTEAMQRVTDLLATLLPDKTVEVIAYTAEMESRYIDSRKFLNSVMTGAVAALIIALTGLIGYVNDEVNRRSAEVAIRKINGAKVREILQLFGRDILKIALPALCTGSVIAAFTAQKWMEGFSEKTNLSVPLFALCVLCVLAVILASVAVNTRRIAMKNPVETIKSE